MVLAYIVQKKQVGLNKFLDFLAILPGAIPGMFLGIGFVLAFNGGWLSLTGTGAIMVLALLFWNLPPVTVRQQQACSRSAPRWRTRP